MPIYSYEKGGKEHWYYAFEVKDKNGKRKTIKQRGFTGRKAAQAAERDARTAWERGQHVDYSTMTVGEYMAHWLDNKKNLSEQSRYNNENAMKLHILPHIGHIQLTKLTADHIEEWVKTLQSKVGKRKEFKKNLSDGTIKKIFNLVDTALSAAEKKGTILKNPVQLMDTKPTVKKPLMDYWRPEEVKAFLNGFEHRNKIIFTLAIYCGMRLGEIIGLDRDKDIDLENKRIYIRQIVAFKGKLKSGAKTDSGNRSIEITDYVANEIRRHKDAVLAEKAAAGKEYRDHGLLICRPDGAPCTPQSVREVWYKLLRKTGVRPIRFHDLRHTCATLLLTAGIHPKVVQELLGHSSIKITLDYYSHVIPSMQSEAMNTLGKLLE